MGVAPCLPGAGRVPPIGADGRVALDPESPRHLVCGRYADTRTGLDQFGRHGFGWGCDREWSRAVDHRCAVRTPVQGEDLSQLRRAGGEVAIGLRGRPTGTCQVQAVKHLPGPQQDSGGSTLFAADHVQALIHAVDLVHVQHPGGAEHDLVAVRHAAVRVAGRIGAEPAVRLDLGEPHGDTVGAEPPPEQLPRRPVDISGGQVEPGESVHRPYGIGSDRSAGRTGGSARAGVLHRPALPARTVRPERPGRSEQVPPAAPAGGAAGVPAGHPTKSWVIQTTPLPSRTTLRPISLNPPLSRFLRWPSSGGTSASMLSVSPFAALTMSASPAPAEA